ncbi:hypothetical protein PFDG_04404 [Plasmodium falciparum Dd2]|uniref:Uncharacterized protein n=1 Tax=Plasmodium falciparum (isolate Dd2) TaxID=57267 RepID=A0A0L7M510_PLAF4|nr:hypothetical protein PFDG_04404 [Plasmodium falciparum Dd2]
MKTNIEEFFISYHSNSLFKKSKQCKSFNHELNKENELKGEEDTFFLFPENILDEDKSYLPFDKEKIMASIKKHKKEDDNIKNILKKTKKHCNYLTNKLGRLNKKLREIKKLETVFYANPNILTEEQKVKLSKKDQVKNEIVIINRYRKKYISYKRNLQKNVDDTSPFFYNKKKKKEKKKFCTPEEFREICNKKVDIYIIYVYVYKVGGENYFLNIKEGEVKVFDPILCNPKKNYNKAETNS